MSTSPVLPPAAEQSRRSARRPWRFSVIGLVAALMLQGGLCLLLYPHVAAWVSQFNQSNIVREQSDANAERAAAELKAMLSDARTYNEQLDGGAQLGSHANLATGVGVAESSLDYWKLLAAGPTESMARLRVPAIDLDLPVYHGTSDATLLAGVGHLQGTSLPVGGQGTRTVLTGHRGLANATMFTHLDRVAVDDTFSIEVLGEVFTYRVFDIQVVEPSDSEEIRTVAGRDLATLVTCTPLGINTQRILVTGERVSPTPPEDAESIGASPDVPGFPWALLLLGVGTLGVWGWYARSGFSGNRGHHTSPGDRLNL